MGRLQPYVAVLSHLLALPCLTTGFLSHNPRMLSDLHVLESPTAVSFHNGNLQPRIDTQAIDAFRHS